MDANIDIWSSTKTNKNYNKKHGKKDKAKGGV